MKVLDLNLLVYAVDENSPYHARARTFVESCLSGEVLAGIPWIVVAGFLRVTTHLRILSLPRAPDTAATIVDGWFKRGKVVALEPGPQHRTILRKLITEEQITGNLHTDAHIAALAHHRARRRSLVRQHRLRPFPRTPLEQPGSPADWAIFAR